MKVYIHFWFFFFVFILNQCFKPLETSTTFSDSIRFTLSDLYRFTDEEYKLNLSGFLVYRKPLF